MSASTSTDQSDQRPQASFSEKMRSATPSQTHPTKPRHSPNPRAKHHKSADRASTIIGSRIEKKLTTHGNRNAASSPRATASEVLIRVFINNRLGTKTEILCSPSDTIGAFKRIAAVYLGTRPEAMTLKRQGERPFKDSLTLEDYEIGNGSALDLEIDTCDS
ncbi:hypothetical protein HO173_002754 [Letharia columbiana]|uniref:Ubiquitin-like modifier HUB1 n=1 Tax=Letharia columbiana TaxID=112416 RepID=A0A8H6G1N2_9LECA|nr:uncharacterized protein HO173_002754 [Letharia columbiana]KAF6238882.1 hypothetical protein HO173_002754 [Letharia columbiana]